MVQRIWDLLEVNIYKFSLMSWENLTDNGQQKDLNNMT